MAYEFLEKEKLVLNALLQGDETVRAFILKNYIPEHFVQCHELFGFVRERLGMGDFSSIALDSMENNTIFGMPLRGIIGSLRFVPVICDPAQIDTIAKDLVENYNQELLLEVLRPYVEKLQDQEAGAEDTLRQLQLALETAAVKISSTTTTPVGLGKDSDLEYTIERTISANNNVFLRTGITTFDKTVGGISRGDLVILAAPSSHGKTLMLLTLTLNMLFDTPQENSALFITMEVGEETIMHRLVASREKIPLKQVREIVMPNSMLTEYLPEDRHAMKLSEVEQTREKVRQALGGLNTSLKARNKKLTIKTFGVFTPEDLLRELALFPYDIVVIDYLNLMTTSGSAGEADWLRLSSLARDLKNIATTRKLSCVTAQQLDERTLQIRYSKAVKEHCDILMQWELPPDLRDAGGGTTEMKVMKGRNIGTFSFPMTFDLTTQRAFEPDGSEDFTGTPLNQPDFTYNFGGDSGMGLNAINPGQLLE
jgi:replicative DNA helicase